MIQPLNAATSPSPKPQSHRYRNAKFTARHRRAHARRTRYANCVRVIAVLAVLIVPVMLYVMLTANVTGLNYAIAHAESERAQLQEDAQGLDDKIAHLESRDRLAVVASKLNMRDPESYTIVSLPLKIAAPKPSGLAFLEWFKRP
jgi:hypothetical protein